MLRRGGVRFNDIKKMSLNNLKTFLKALNNEIDRHEADRTMFLMDEELKEINKLKDYKKRTLTVITYKTLKSSLTVTDLEAGSSALSPEMGSSALSPEMGSSALSREMGSSALSPEIGSSALMGRKFLEDVAVKEPDNAFLMSQSLNKRTRSPYTSSLFTIAEVRQTENITFRKRQLNDQIDLSRDRVAEIDSTLEDCRRDLRDYVEYSSEEIFQFDEEYIEIQKLKEKEKSLTDERSGLVKLVKDNLEVVRRLTEKERAFHNCGGFPGLCRKV